MGKAEFPLEVLLGHRRRQEEARQLELSICQRHLDEARNDLDRLVERREAFLLQLREEQTARVLDLPAIDRSLAYIASLETAIAEREKTVATLTTECEKAREALIKASQSSKVVTKLKDAWAADWRREDLRQEDKALAEAALAQFHRKQSAPGWVQ